jgi:hypothetical protein
MKKTHAMTKKASMDDDHRTSEQKASAQFANYAVTGPPGRLPFDIQETTSALNLAVTLLTRH